MGVEEKECLEEEVQATILTEETANLGGRDNNEGAVKEYPSEWENDKRTDTKRNFSVERSRQNGYDFFIFTWWSGCVYLLLQLSCTIFFEKGEQRGN